MLGKLGLTATGIVISLTLLADLLFTPIA